MSEDIQKTLDERGKRYGEFEEHASITQGLKHMMHPYEGKLTSYQKEALEMVFHKIGRILNGDAMYLESWRDMVGYLQLVVNIMEETEGVTDGRVTIVTRRNNAWIDENISVARTGRMSCGGTTLEEPGECFKKLKEAREDLLRRQVVPKPSLLARLEDSAKAIEIEAKKRAELSEAQAELEKTRDMLVDPFNFDGSAA